MALYLQSPTRIYGVVLKSTWITSHFLVCYFSCSLHCTVLSHVGIVIASPIQSFGFKDICVCLRVFNVREAYIYCLVNTAC
jgi:hypothetical protein